MEIVSLPVGGMMTRIAWGSTILRITANARHAERLRRLGLAVIDRDDAGANDLRHVRSLIEAEAEDGGEERGDRFVGTARPTRGG